MRKTVKTEGIVLKKKHLLEKDILLTVFTGELGKVVMIAKGVKKITSRRAPHVQTGNLIEAEIMQRDEKMYLQTSNLISAFSQIKADQNKTNFMYTYFFILDRILPDHQQEPTVYHQTKVFLVEMARADEFTPQMFAHSLYILLSSLGYVHEELSLSELIRRTEDVINEKIPLNTV